MTLSNHLLSGAVIASIVQQPALAVALAFASHFLLDALPHFGYPGRKGYTEALKHRLSYIVATIDILTVLGLSMWLLASSHKLAFWAGWAAILPDLIGLLNYLAYDKYNKQPDRVTRTLHVRFHRAIQRYERPWGLIVEAGTFTGLAMAFSQLS